VFAIRVLTQTQAKLFPLLIEEFDKSTQGELQ
jgi:hypothetical protein